jgi:hypothetical protein
MGDLAPIWSIILDLISTHRASITLVIIAASLCLAALAFRRAEEFLRALKPGDFSPPKRGRPPVKIETLERHARDAAAYANNKWRVIGYWVLKLFTAGLIIPTLCLILLGFSFPLLFDGTAGFAIVSSECSRAAPTVFSSPTSAQFLTLLLASMVPPDAIQFLPGWLAFSTTFNLDSSLMYLAFFAHKFVAVSSTWKILKDLLYRLPDLHSGSKERVDEIKARIAQAKMELE